MSLSELPKCPTGIAGLDAITGGGLPQGRSTLLCGGTGVGKTLLGLEFLVHGANQYGEAGVFITLEEDDLELISNADSLGFDIGGLLKSNRLEIDHVVLERSEITGAYDLDGLFIRLDLALVKVNAKRIVLDSVDMLFMSFPSPVLIREEIRRLLRWIKKRGITVVITSAGGGQNLTRDGMEEYVSDCVIALDNRIAQQCTTRFLRIVKYRGSAHGSNEYPFLIGPTGISVLPITLLETKAPVSTEHISSGIHRLDTMLDGKGYYRGSTIMVSGPPGSGKTSVASKFAEAACARGERCLYFLLEESAEQMTRNMQSIRCDLQPYVELGLLRFVETRMYQYGIEEHLARFHQSIVDFTPSVAVFDPLSVLHHMEDKGEFRTLVVRVVNFLKARQITTLLTVGIGRGNHPLTPDVCLSSSIDSWVALLDVEANGERTRLLQIMKSRGMAHSNQLREFKLTGNGIELIDVYTGRSGVLTGTARVAQEAEESALREAKDIEASCRARNLATRLKRKNAQIAALEAAFAAEEVEHEHLIILDQMRTLEWIHSSQQMAKAREADSEVAAVPANPTNAD